MRSRAELVAQIVEIVGSGRSVDIVGDRGSGRSRMLHEITDAARHRSWNITSVVGNASLSSYPLVALSLAGVASARDSRPSALPAVVAELAEQLPQRTSLVLIDDWDDLDEVSWGAIVTLNRLYRIPYVLTRQAGRTGRATPRGLHTSNLAAACEIALGPLSYAELELALTEHLGIPIESSAVSGLYAKSGGNVGLALALLDAGRWEGSFEVRNDRLATAREQWAPSMAVTAELLLEPLPETARRVLETLSLLGATDLTTALSFAELATLEQLEGLGFLESNLVGRQHMVDVRPPLLAEYFRHLRPGVRRANIMESLSGILEPADSVGVTGSLQELGVSATQFIRLVEQQQKARSAAARARWQASSALEEAVELIDALLDSSADDDEIDALFDETISVPGSHSTKVRWWLLWAEHRAHAHREPQAALQRLHTEASSFPRLGRILTSRSVEMELQTGSVPDLALIPAPSADTDPTVAAAVLRARAFVHTSLGRFSEADAELALLEKIDAPHPDHIVASIRAFTAIARADVESAVSVSTSAFAEAEYDFDVGALLAHGEIVIFCALLEGRYGDANRVLDQILAVGHSQTRLPLARLSLTLGASIVAARQGNRSLAKSRLDEAARFPIHDGPFPTQARGWAQLQLALGQGAPEEAAAIAAAAGDRMWEGGARFAAALAYLTGLELLPDPQELERTSPRLEAVEGVFVSAHREYVTALVGRDAGGMEAAASRLWAQHRAGIALTAYRQAIDLYAARGAGEDAARLLERYDELNGLAGGQEATRFDARFVQLSGREVEIAQLAASGLSNPQIAEQLSLSVRTVESHLHRAMRKAGIAKRQQLLEFLQHIGY